MAGGNRNYSRLCVVRFSQVCSSNLFRWLFPLPEVVLSYACAVQDSLEGDSLQISGAINSLSLSVSFIFFFTIKIPLSNGETQLQGNEVGCEADGVENYYSTKAHKIPML